MADALDLKSNRVNSCESSSLSSGTTVMDKIGSILALSAALMWGIAYSIDQKILTKVSPLSILAVSSLVAVIIVVPFFFASPDMRKELFSLNKETVLLTALSMIIGIIGNILILNSIKRIGATEASMLEITYPFFITLFSIVLFKQPLTLPFIAGSLLIFAGASLIIGFN